MPKTIPASFIPEKNKLNTPNATILLCEIKVSGQTPIYLARNTENFISNGQTYTALPFELDAIKETSKGNLPQITLRVANVTRALEATLQEYNGIVDAEIAVKAVNAGNPDDSILELNFDVLSSESDDKWIYLNLGAPSPLRKRFPPDRYMADYCPWIPGGAECGVSAATDNCDRTHNDCRARFSNTRRFGGHMGLSNPNVRFV